MKKKVFFKFFLAFLVAFTLVFMPIVKAVSNVNLFKNDVTEIVEGYNADKRGVFVAQTGAFHSDYEDLERLNLLGMGVNNKMTDTIMLVSWNMKDNSVDVIDMNGHVLRSLKPARRTDARSDAKKAAKQLDTVTQYLKRVADEENVR